MQTKSSCAFFRKLLVFALLFLPLSTLCRAQNLQWRPLYEPGVGGAVTSLSVSPYNSNIVLSGGDIIGAARSIDSGVTWTPVLPGLQNAQIEQFTWNPTGTNTVWVATSAGPFVSNDAGATWSLKRTGLPADGSNQWAAATQVILYDPANSSRLLAFFGNRRDDLNYQPNAGSVYVSNDSGNNWSLLSQVVAGGNINAASFAANSATVFAVIPGQGVLRSPDRGQSWSAANTGLPTTDVKYIATHPTNAQIAWVALGDGSGVYQTIDGGNSWSPSNGSGVTHLPGINFRHIAVAPSNPSLLFAMNKGNTDLYRSNDGGANWAAVSAPSAKAIAINFEAGQVSVDARDPSRVFASTWNSIFRSTDGGVTFNDLSSYLPVPANDENWRGRGYSGYVARNFYWNPANLNTAYTVGMDDAFWVSLDGLKTWKSGVSLGLPDFGGTTDLSFTHDGQTIYGTRGQAGWSFGHGIIKSTDGGQSWAQVSYPSQANAYDPYSLPTGVYVNPLNGQQVWVTIGGRLYQSSNGGTSWILNALQDAGGSLDFIVGRGTSPATDFFISGRSGVYHTTDGSNFTLIGGPQNWQYGQTRLRIDPTNPNRLYVIPFGYFDYVEGLWRGTYDSGTNSWSWQRLAGTLYISPQIARISDIAINPANPDQAILSTRKDPYESTLDANNATGVWVTSNLTAAAPSWTQQNTGLGTLSVNTVQFKPDGSGIVVAGTNASGFRIAKWDGTTVDTGVGVNPPDNPGNTAAADSITINSIPTNVAPGTTLTALINYHATTTRIIQIALYDPATYGWVNAGTTTVSAGAGTATVYVNVPASIATGTGHLFIDLITSDYSQSLQQIQRDITVAVPDSISIASIPSSVPQGSTLTATINYTASDTRIIQVAFYAPVTYAWTSVGSVTVGAGSGSRAININIPSSVAAGTGHLYIDLLKSDYSQSFQQVRQDFTVTASSGGSGANLVVNPSFEANAKYTQTPSGWSEWSDTTSLDASFAEANGGGVGGGSSSGTYNGSHWKSGKYRVYTYQNFSGLVNGAYTLTAKMRRSAGQIAAQIEAKNFGGNTTLFRSPPISKTWQAIIPITVQVSNGQCTIGFWSDASAGQWMQFDQVSFTKN